MEGREYRQDMQVFYNSKMIKRGEEPVIYEGKMVLKYVLFMPHLFCIFMKVLHDKKDRTLTDNEGSCHGSLAVSLDLPKSYLLCSLYFYFQ
ncbi:hypothetical protein CAI16_09480 [Virgibacillus dokdonensis]|uniref:Uncharacterized protein n=1 Tax=Virgibacillus dokdonensis TaxID=302167 RepID=A0A3E0WSE7_9BACI|nr:hypothetical protein CAI16_09480 [Virgibacillus dokdonensis]